MKELYENLLQNLTDDRQNALEWSLWRKHDLDRDTQLETFASEFVGRAIELLIDQKIAEQYIIKRPKR